MCLKWHLVYKRQHAQVSYSLVPKVTVGLNLNNCEAMVFLLQISNLCSKYMAKVPDISSLLNIYLFEQSPDLYALYVDHLVHWKYQTG